MVSALLAQELEDQLMKFTAKSVETKAETGLIDCTKKVFEDADVDVDIIGLSKLPGNQFNKTKVLETTESSSSFDDTSSGDENEDIFAESEASSSIRDDGVSHGGFDRSRQYYSKRMKRNVSSQWRSFIQPLAWRFKWVELELKLLEQLSRRCDRKVEAQRNLKKSQLDKSEVEGRCAKQIPFTRINGANGVMRRKRRKRSEVTTNLTTYVTHHNLLSYYEKIKQSNEDEAKVIQSKVPARKASEQVENDDEPWMIGESLLESQDGGNNSSNVILRKIFDLRSKVIAMKSGIDEILSEIGGTSYLPENSNMSVPVNASVPINGNTPSVGNYIVSQLMTEYYSNDNLVPGNQAVGHGDIASNIDRSSEAYGNGEDEVLISYRRVKQVMGTFEDVNVRSTQVQSSLAIRDGSEHTNSLVQTEDYLTLDDGHPHNIRSGSTCTSPRGKRRGNRNGDDRVTKRGRGK